MKEQTDTYSLGITYQMSLDAFLQETHPIDTTKKDHYEEALDKLKELKQFRSWSKKRAIAKDALELCEDCIEAYLALGLYAEHIFDTLRIYKDALEQTTMTLGRDYFQQPIPDFYELGETRMFFHMKFAYACALYEAGYMRRAQTQFQEILAFNPSDVFHVRYYLFACDLYFEEFEKFKQLLERYPSEDTLTSYATFLYFYKKQLVEEAKSWLPILYGKNHYLYQILSYEVMNIGTSKEDFLPGSEQEAAYCHVILQKVTQSLEHLPSFLVKEHIE